MVSGMLAIAVIRCSQNASVPVLAEPSPRTRPSGVRMLMVEAPSSHAGNDQDRPQENSREDRADDVRPHQPLALSRLEAVAEVPDEIAQAADEMMQQRPGEAEQDQPADPARREALEG